MAIDDTLTLLTYDGWVYPLLYIQIYSMHVIWVKFSAEWMKFQPN